MDLNYLLFREQVALMRADSAAGPEARLAHRALARGYADRIRTVQADFALRHVQPVEG